MEKKVQSFRDVHMRFLKTSRALAYVCDISNKETALQKIKKLVEEGRMESVPQTFEFRLPKLQREIYGVYKKPSRDPPSHTTCKLHRGFVVRTVWITARVST